MLSFQSCFKAIRTLHIVLGFLMSAWATPAMAEPVDDIIWTLTPLPPAMVEENGKIVGYGVDTLDWFIDRLPDYRHKKEIVPLPRLMQSLVDGGTLCNIGMTPTPERQKILLFSDAVLPHLPVSLVTQTKNDYRLEPYLDAENHVDLARLIQSRKLSGAVRSQRSYGPTIDAILKSQSNSPNMTMVGTDEQFLPMITLGRVDWTLYHPAELEYHRRQKTPDVQFTAWEIAGNDPVMQASIACTKTPTGRSVVNDINALSTAHPDMPWIRFYAASLSAADRQRYEHEIDIWIARKKGMSD